MIVVVTVIIVLAVIVIAYFIRLRVKSVKKTKSLKHLKDETLLKCLFTYGDSQDDMNNYEKVHGSFA